MRPKTLIMSVVEYLACAGIPTEAEYVAMYCRARSIPPPDAQTWSFFMALSLFRAAAILAGVGARAKLGNASSERAAVVCLLLPQSMIILLLVEMLPGSHGGCQVAIAQMLNVRVGLPKAYLKS